MTVMQPDREAALRAAAAVTRKRKAAYEDARAHLNSLIFEAKQEDDTGPSEIGRITELTREWVAKVIAAEEKRRSSKSED